MADATDVIRPGGSLPPYLPESPSVSVSAPTYLSDPNQLPGGWGVASKFGSVVIIAALFAWLVALEIPRQQRESLRITIDAHRETVDRMERIIDVERRASSVRDEINMRVIERNTNAVEKLADEVRALRQSRDRTKE